MTGFEAADMALVTSALEEFMPEVITIKRRSSSQTRGDYVKTTDATIATGIKGRIQPITPLGTEKTRLKSFPASIADRAEYLITLQNSVAYKDGDIVIPESGLEYSLLAVRFDNASWRPVVRAVAVRVE